MSPRARRTHAWLEIAVEMHPVKKHVLLAIVVAAVMAALARLGVIPEAPPLISN